MADAIVLSELGVGLPIFIICPLVASYFGGTPDQKPHLGRALGDYVRSPIFIAVIAGVLASQLCLPLDDPLLAPIFKAFDMIDGALAVIACIILGLSLVWHPLGKIIPLVAISAAIQMGLQPFLAGLQADWYGLNTTQHQILVLIAAMPSAVLGPVFATQYHSDADTASALVFANIILSALIVPITFSTFCP